MPFNAQADALTQFGTAVLESFGVPTTDAHLLADSLTTAELWGHSSHGMLRLPWYVDRLRSGVMTAVTAPETVMDGGAIAVLDGRHGIGQVLTKQATELGIERARTASVPSQSATPIISAPRRISRACLPKPVASPSSQPMRARRWHRGAVAKRPSARIRGR